MQSFDVYLQYLLFFILVQNRHKSAKNCMCIIYKASSYSYIAHDQLQYHDQFNSIMMIFI